MCQRTKFFLFLGLFVPLVSGQPPTCDEFTTVPGFAPNQNLDFRYISKITDPATGDGELTVELTYAGTAWLGFGYTQVRRMVPGEAVIGSPTDGVFKWNLLDYLVDTSAIGLQSSQTLTNTSFVQNGTHTVLRFTKALREANEIPINGSDANVFLWAIGNGNTLGYHGLTRAVEDVTLVACSEPGSPTATPTTALPTISSAPSSNPTSVADVDCTQFQTTVQLDPSLTLEYVVNVNDSGNSGDGVMTARLTHSGQAWVGLGVAPLNSRFMVPADAIIGLPNNNNNAGVPRKYSMTGRSVPGVQLVDSQQQTLMNATLTQANGMTVMTFTKNLKEFNDITINPDGINTFLWAYGSGNSLGHHARRGVANIRLRPCGSGRGDDGIVEVIGTGTQEELWAAHGVMASIAWAVLSPLAIGSSLLRNFLPQGKTWLRLHVYLNFSVLALTIGAFVTAFTAQQRKGLSHFSGVAHTTIGLVVLVFCALQVLGGIFRAHAPHGEETKKSPIRVVWELGHKSMGVGLLAVCWFQVQGGLGLYFDRFGGRDLRPAFWGVVAGLAVIILSLFVYDKAILGDDDDNNGDDFHPEEQRQGKEADDDDGDDDDEE